MANIEKKTEKTSKAPLSHAEKLKAKQEREAKSDAAWEQSFENSRGVLRKLAEKARQEYREGRTEELDPDNL
jgi:hypothetical protein